MATHSSSKTYLPWSGCYSSRTNFSPTHGVSTWILCEAPFCKGFIGFIGLWPMAENISYNPQISPGSITPCIYIYVYIYHIYIIISKTPFVDGSTFAHFAPHPPVEPIASLWPGVAKCWRWQEILFYYIMDIMDIVNILVDIWMDISWSKAYTRFEKQESLEDNADIHGSVHEIMGRYNKKWTYPLGI